MTYSASIRLSSRFPTERIPETHKDRRSPGRAFGSDSSRNFGGAFAHFSADALHQFFGQVGKSQPHQVISQQLARHKANMGEKNLMETQKREDLRETQKLKASDFVAEAAKWADDLTKAAEQTHGSKEAAIEAVARKTGVNHSTLWSLRYRKPKDIAVSIYMKLKGAYERELMRQEGLLRHDNEIRRAKMGNADSLVVETEAFLAALDSAKGE